MIELLSALSMVLVLVTAREVSAADYTPLLAAEHTHRAEILQSTSTSLRASMPITVTDPANVDASRQPHVSIDVPVAGEVPSDADNIEMDNSDPVVIPGEFLPSHVRRFNHENGELLSDVGGRADTDLHRSGQRGPSPAVPIGAGVEAEGQAEPSVWRRPTEEALRSRRCRRRVTDTLCIVCSFGALLGIAYGFSSMCSDMCT